MKREISTGLVKGIESCSTLKNQNRKIGRKIRSIHKKKLIGKKSKEKREVRSFTSAEVPEW